MSIFVGTVTAKDNVASVDLPSAIAADAQYGLALDSFAMGFTDSDHQVGLFQAMMDVQGLANDNKTLRSIMQLQLVDKVSGVHANCTANALALTCAAAATDANPDVTLDVMASQLTGNNQLTYSSTSVSLSYAYPALAGFDVSANNNAVQVISYASGLQNDGVASASSISWAPKFVMNSYGSVAFLIVGIPSGSPVPPAQTFLWSPGGTPMATVTFSGLATAVGSAAILIDSFQLEYAIWANILDIALSAGNETCTVTCTQNNDSTYDATVRFVPQLMMRDASGNQLSTSSSSIGFRVLVFPGTPVQTQG